MSQGRQKRRNHPKIPFVSRPSSLLRRHRPFASQHPPNMPSHRTFLTRRGLLLSRAVAGFGLGALLLGTVAAAQVPPGTQASMAVRPAAAGTRGPFDIAFLSRGDRAMITEFDSNTISLIDATNGKLIRRFPCGGEEPTGVDVSRDDAMVAFTNSFSGSVGFLDPDTGKLDQLRLRGMPYDCVFAPDARTLYVSVSQRDVVAVVDVAARKVLGEIPTGRRPRALSLSPDGAVLVSANLTDGSLTFIDTAAGKGVTAPTPAVNVRGVAVIPGGRLAFCTGQRAQNERPTRTAVGIWSNQAFLQSPYGGRNGLQNIWLDLIGEDVSDPDQVILDPQGRFAFMTCSGGHSLQKYELRGANGNTSLRGIGAQPRGLALRPGTAEIWVTCVLSNELVVIDSNRMEVLRRIPLDPPSVPDPTLPGRFLFVTSTITDGGQFSCNSCHPDANTDGISWKFVHVKDALGEETLRNVRGLRGPLKDTAPYRWTGHDAGLADFIREEVKGLLQSPPLSQTQVEELIRYITSQRLPANPFRKDDGTNTDAGLRGKALFNGKAGCVACHGGRNFGGNAAAGGELRVNVGTTPAGTDLDVPHLVGVYDTYPYLHTGEAKSLEEVLTRYNTRQLHGKAHELTPEELRDLVAFVREL